MTLLLGTEKENFSPFQGAFIRFDLVFVDTAVTAEAGSSYLTVLDIWKLLDPHE